MKIQNYNYVSVYSWKKTDFQFKQDNKNCRLIKNWI